MRSVGSQASVFGIECFLDEMAAAAKADPVAYRRHLLRRRPRELAVVEKLATPAGWDQPAAAGRHPGFAMNAANRSGVAQIIQPDGSPQPAVRLHRIHSVGGFGIA